MNDELKAVRNLGAELGAAKAENERLRGLLRELREITSEYAWDVDLEAKVDAALSTQAEPADTFTAVDMATAAAQGFRDGQAAVEQAPAQDDQYPPCDYCGVIPDHHPWHGSGMFNGEDSPHIHACNDCRHLLPTRPAQTEQQPVGRVLTYEESLRTDGKSGPAFWFGPLPAGAFLYAAPIAQTAPQPDQSGWVSASERVPAENDGEVLVLMADGTCEIAWASYWHGARTDFAGWTFRDPDEDRTPTHWMPLPALSAQGQSNGDS